MDERMEEAREKIVDILDSHEVEKASVFGSAVHGDMAEGSDVDILVELKEGKSLLDLVSLKHDLEDALDLEVDVVTFDSLHPSIRDRVLEEQEALV